MRGVAWLDLTADTARLFVRTPDLPKKLVPLEPGQDGLKLALRVEGKKLILGHTAWQQRRLAPHLVVPSFIPHFGDDTMRWRLGRHQTTPGDAVKLLLTAVKERLAGQRRLLVTLPSTWTNEQAKRLRQMLTGAGFEVLGLLPRELLAGLDSSSGEAAWKHEAVVVGADEHSFAAAILRPTVTDLRQVAVKSVPRLARSYWRERLIDRVARRCVATERRDPRALPEAEQLLYDQSDGWFTALGQGNGVVAEAYLSHRALPCKIPLTATNAAEECGDLATAAATAVLSLHQRCVRPELGGTLFLTPEAAELPGLVAELYRQTEHRVPVTVLAADLVCTALSLAESVAEKERLPIDFATRAVAFPVAEFTFDAPQVLTFPGERRAAE